MDQKKGSMPQKCHQASLLKEQSNRSFQKELTTKTADIDYNAKAVQPDKKLKY